MQWSGITQGEMDAVGMAAHADVADDAAHDLVRHRAGDQVARGASSLAGGVTHRIADGACSSWSAGGCTATSTASKAWKMLILDTVHLLLNGDGGRRGDRGLAAARRRNARHAVAGSPRCDRAARSESIEVGCRAGPGRAAAALPGGSRRISSSLRVPAAAPPARADGLWRHTCFEAFIAAPGSRPPTAS